ncbi:MAG: hypothetical protein GX606_03585 [Elusimicrobia bacterium]|nr:hypothetical protein [Elusimicrobiota bacterium]
MSIAGNVLRITHGPLPAGRARTVQRSDVKQLYSDERIVHGKHGRSVHYGVKAILKSGGEIDLIYGLPDRKEALFIEQQVERHFGIRDEAVPGEVER